MSTKKKEKVFKSGFTALALIIFVFLLASSGAMIARGLMTRSRYLPEDQFVCCFLPAIIGTVILILWIVNITSQLGQEITITPRIFHYRKGSFEIQSSWDDLVFDAPDPTKRFLRSITFCNGAFTVSIYDIYFPEFETLAKVMSAAKKRSSEVVAI